MALQLDDFVKIRLADEFGEDMAKQISAILAQAAASNQSVAGTLAVTGNTDLGANLVQGAAGAERATVKSIVYSGTIVVAVPSITDPDIARVQVSIAALTFAAAVGDAVIAIPLEALPTACRLQGAFVYATDGVEICFGSEGGSVTGANKNFGFLIFDLT